MWFRNSLRDPSWVVAYALSLQLLIFGLQAWIFGKHAKTFEAHKDIADRQATTADLIRTALQNQETISKSQLNLQRQLESQSERRIVFDLMTTLLTSVDRLTEKLSRVTTITKEVNDELNETFIKVRNDATVSRMAILSTQHLSQDELNHFSAYLDDVNQLKQTNAPNHADYFQLKAFQDRHKDFLKIVAENRKTAIAAITSGT